MAQFRAPKFYTGLFTTSSTPRLGCYFLDCATILTVYTSCLGMTSWAVVHALENVEGNSRVWIERGISVGTSSFASHYVKIYVDLRIPHTSLCSLHSTQSPAFWQDSPHGPGLSKLWARRSCHSSSFSICERHKAKSFAKVNAVYHPCGKGASKNQELLRITTKITEHFYYQIMSY